MRVGCAPLWPRSAAVVTLLLALSVRVADGAPDDCAAGEFFDIDTCRTLTAPCGRDSYESQEPGPSQDRACTPCSPACAAGVGCAGPAADDCNTATVYAEEDSSAILARTSDRRVITAVTLPGNTARVTDIEVLSFGATYVLVLTADGAVWLSPVVLTATAGVPAELVTTISLNVPDPTAVATSIAASTADGSAFLVAIGGAIYSFDQDSPFPVELLGRSERAEHIAYDLSTDTLYWWKLAPPWRLFSLAEGGAPVTIGLDTETMPTSLAVDAVRARVSWTTGDGAFHEAELDGSNAAASTQPLNAPLASVQVVRGGTLMAVKRVGRSGDPQLRLAASYREHTSVTEPTFGSLDTGTIVAADGGNAGGVTGIGPAGDVNGDGLVDILMLMPNRDSDSAVDSGALCILQLGVDGSVLHQQMISSSEGLNGGVTLAIAAGDQFGFSATTIGDHDGDGTPDVIVGAPMDDTGASDSGAAYVLLLDDDGRVATASKLISSAEISIPGDAKFGSSVAAAGDLDVDGIGDVLVGARDYGDYGAVYAVLLGATGTATSSVLISSSSSNVGFSPVSPTTGQLFGCSVAGLRDVSSDGYPDAVVGVGSDDDGAVDAGGAYLISFDPTTLDSAPGSVAASTKLSGAPGTALVDIGFTPSGGDGLGLFVSVLDLDNEDVVVLSGQDAGPGPGYALVLFLDESGLLPRAYVLLDSSVSAEVNPLPAELRFRADNGVAGFGSGAVLLGRDPHDSLRIAFGAPDAGGSSAGGGFFIVGPEPPLHVPSHWTELSAATQGSPGSFPADLVANDNTNLGTLGAAGDINGDGVPDLLIGMFDYHHLGVAYGAVFVALLSEHGTVLDYELITKDSACDECVGGVLDVPAESAFGSGVDGGVDWDGDGVPDAVVGAIDDQSGKGAMMVLLFNSDGSVKAASLISDRDDGGTPLGPQGLGADPGGDSFGQMPKWMDDFDGDGSPEVGCGAWGNGPSNTRNGEFYVLFLDPGTAMYRFHLLLGESRSVATQGQLFGGANAYLGWLPSEPTKFVILIAAHLEESTGAVYAFVVEPSADAMSTDRVGKLSQVQGQLTQAGVSPAGGTYYGADLCRVSDIDGDGVAEFFVTQMVASGTGRIDLLFLDDSQISVRAGIRLDESGSSWYPTDFITRIDPNDHMTYVAAIGPPADGALRFVVGIRKDDNGGITDAGAVFIFTSEPLEFDERLTSTVELSSGTSGTDGRLDAGTNPTGTGTTGAIETFRGIDDVNGDGAPDMVVGLPFDDAGGEDAGAVMFLFLARDSSVIGQQRVSPSGEGLDAGVTLSVTAGHMFGTDVINIPDLDGDGVPEAAATVAIVDGNRGRLVLLFLNIGATVHTVHQISDGGTNGLPGGTLAAGDMMTRGLVVYEDIDGDDLPEIGVSPFQDSSIGTERGSHLILSVSTTGAVTKTRRIRETDRGFTPATTADEQWFGVAVAALPIGTSDNGRQVVAIAAQGTETLHMVELDPTVDDATVSAFAEISATSGGLSEAGLSPDDASGFPGDAVTVLPDIDADGRSELIVSNVASSGTGYMAILFLTADAMAVRSLVMLDDSNASPLPLAAKALVSPNTRWGSTHAYLGRGHNEMVRIGIGAPGATFPGSGDGAIYIIHRTTTRPVAGIQTVDPVATEYSAATEGNAGSWATGSTFADMRLGQRSAFSALGSSAIAIGMHLSDDGSAEAGAVLALFFDVTGAVESQQKISMTAGGFASSASPEALSASHHFGASVAWLDDRDGDGDHEMVVGAPDDTETTPGSLWVLHLTADAQVTAALRLGVGSPGGLPAGYLTAGERLGNSVCNLGDIDGDGYDDIAAGARIGGAVTSDKGAVLIVQLRQDGRVRDVMTLDGGVGLNMWSPLRHTAQQRFGAALATIDGGLGQIVLFIGVPEDDDGAPNAGAGYLVSFPSPSPGVSVQVASSAKLSILEGGLGASVRLGEGSGWGSGAATLPDIDGNGASEVLVAASAGWLDLLYMDADGTGVVSSVRLDPLARQVTLLPQSLPSLPFGGAVAVVDGAAAYLDLMVAMPMYDSNRGVMYRLRIHKADVHVVTQDVQALTSAIATESVLVGAGSSSPVAGFVSHTCSAACGAGCDLGDPDACYDDICSSNAALDGEQCILCSTLDDPVLAFAGQVAITQGHEQVPAPITDDHGEHVWVVERSFDRGDELVQLSSDGQVGNDFLVDRPDELDIGPGVTSGSPQNLYWSSLCSRNVEQGCLLFSAEMHRYGREPHAWIPVTNDPTYPRLLVVHDVIAGSGSDAPEAFIDYASALYFVGESGTLYSISDSDLDAAMTAAASVEVISDNTLLVSGAANTHTMSPAGSILAPSIVAGDGKLWMEVLGQSSSIAKIYSYSSVSGFAEVWDFGGQTSSQNTEGSLRWFEDSVDFNSYLVMAATANNDNDREIYTLPPGGSATKHDVYPGAGGSSNPTDLVAYAAGDASAGTFFVAFTSTGYAVWKLERDAATFDVFAAVSSMDSPPLGFNLVRFAPNAGEAPAVHVVFRAGPPGTTHAAPVSVASPATTNVLQMDRLSGQAAQAEQYGPSVTDANSGGFHGTLFIVGHGSLASSFIHCPPSHATRPLYRHPPSAVVANDDGGGQGGNSDLDAASAWISGQPSAASFEMSYATPVVAELRMWLMPWTGSNSPPPAQAIWNDERTGFTVVEQYSFNPPPNQIQTAEIYLPGPDEGFGSSFAIYGVFGDLSGNPGTVQVVGIDMRPTSGGGAGSSTGSSTNGGDTTPPQYASGYPRAENAGEGIAFDVLVNVDEASQCGVVVGTLGSPAPDVQHMGAGTLGDGSPPLATTATNYLQPTPDTDVRWSVSAALSYSTSYDVWVLCSDFESPPNYLPVQHFVHETVAPPPAIISAQFENSLTALSLRFDTDTDRGTGAGLPASLPCSDLLSVDHATPNGSPHTPSLGDATCSWRSAREVLITIDPSTTSLLVGDSVGLVEAGLIRSGSTDSAAATTVAISIDAPESYAEPTVVLSAPSRVSSCDDLIINAELSGDSGREIAWEVTPTLGGTGQDFVAAASADFTGVAGAPAAPYRGNWILHLPTSSLSAGTTYTVTANLRDILGGVGVGDVEVEVTGDDIPSIRVSGSSTQTVTRSRALSLSVDTAASPCATPEDRLLTLSWSVVAVSGPALNVADFLQADRRVVRVPEDTLSGSTVYDFIATVSVVGTPALSATATIRVQVEPSPLVAVIVGGNRAVASGSRVELDGTVSYDPDSDSTPLLYEWECVQYETVDPCVDVHGTELALSGASPSIAPGSLEPGSVLDVSLTVTDDSEVLADDAVGESDGEDGEDGEVANLVRRASTSVVLTVVGTSNPATVVAQLAGGPTATSAPEGSTSASGVARVKVNTHTNVYVRADTVADVADKVLEWTVVSGTFNPDGPASPFASPTNRLDLVLHPNALRPGESYVFRLTATSSETDPGFAEVHVLGNAAPSGGSVSVSPTSGEMVETTFDLATTGWLDDPQDLPLKYQFAYRRTTLASGQTVSVVVPFGPPSLSSLLVKVHLPAPFVPRELDVDVDGIAAGNPDAVSRARQLALRGSRRRLQDAGEISVEAIVTDALGAVSQPQQVAVDVTVPDIGTSSSTDWVNSVIEGAVAELIAQGRAEAAVALVGELADFLNSDEAADANAAESAGSRDRLMEALLAASEITDTTPNPDGSHPNILQLMLATEAITASPYRILNDLSVDGAGTLLSLATSVTLAEDSPSGMDGVLGSVSLGVVSNVVTAEVVGAAVVDPILTVAAENRARDVAEAQMGFVSDIARSVMRSSVPGQADVVLSAAGVAARLRRELATLLGGTTLDVNVVGDSSLLNRSGTASVTLPSSSVVASAAGGAKVKVDARTVRWAWNPRYYYNATGDERAPGLLGADGTNVTTAGAAARQVRSAVVSVVLVDVEDNGEIAVADAPSPVLITIPYDSDAFEPHDGLIGVNGKLQLPVYEEEQTVVCEGSEGEPVALGCSSPGWGHLSVDCAGAASVVTARCPATSTLPMCQFWDEDAAQWSGSGCRLLGLSSDGASVLCACDHMTDFGAAFGEYAQRLEDVVLNVDEVTLEQVEGAIPVIVAIALIHVAVLAAAFWGAKRDRLDHEAGLARRKADEMQSQIELAKLTGSKMLSTRDLPGASFRARVSSDELRGATPTSKPSRSGLNRLISSPGGTKAKVAARHATRVGGVRGLIQLQLDNHPWLSVLFGQDSILTRPQRALLLLATIMGDMFICTLRVSDADEDEEVTFEERIVTAFIAVIFQVPVLMLLTMMFILTADADQTPDAQLLGNRDAATVWRPLQRCVDQARAQEAKSGKVTQLLLGRGCARLCGAGPHGNNILLRIAAKVHAKCCGRQQQRAESSGNDSVQPVRSVRSTSSAGDTATPSNVRVTETEVVDAPTEDAPLSAHQQRVVDELLKMNVVERAALYKWFNAIKPKEKALSASHRCLHITPFVILLLYTTWCAFFVTAWALFVGPNVANAWLVSYILTMLLGMLVTEPLSVWLKDVVSRVALIGFLHRVIPDFHTLGVDSILASASAAVAITMSVHAAREAGARGLLPPVGEEEEDSAGEGDDAGGAGAGGAPDKGSRGGDDDGKGAEHKGDDTPSAPTPGDRGALRASTGHSLYNFMQDGSDSDEERATATGGAAGGITPVGMIPSETERDTVAHTAQEVDDIDPLSEDKGHAAAGTAARASESKAAPAPPDVSMPTAPAPPPAVPMAPPAGGSETVDGSGGGSSESVAEESKAEASPHATAGDGAGDSVDDSIGDIDALIAETNVTGTATVNAESRTAAASPVRDGAATLGDDGTDVDALLMEVGNPDVVG